MRDILDKLHAVGFSSVDWRELGQRITPTTDLKVIEKDFHKSDRCLEEVIDEWKRKGGNPSWRTLARAVSVCQSGGPNVGIRLLEKVGVGMLFQSIVITIVRVCSVVSLWLKPNIPDPHSCHMHSLLALVRLSFMAEPRLPHALLTSACALI